MALGLRPIGGAPIGSKKLSAVGNAVTATVAAVVTVSFVPEATASTNDEVIANVSPIETVSYVPNASASIIFEVTASVELVVTSSFVPVATVSILPILEYWDGSQWQLTAIETHKSGSWQVFPAHIQHDGSEIRIQ